MKKLLAVLLLATCLFSLFSCGGKDLKEFQATIAASAGSRSEATITMTTVDEFTLKSTSKVFETETKGTSVMMVYQFNPITLDRYYNPEVPEDMYESIYASNPSEDAGWISVGSLTFNKKYFKNKEYTIDEKGTFKAVITNIEGFFGVMIPSISEADVTIRTSGYGIKDMTIKYTSPLGTAVEIVVSYYYE